MILWMATAQAIPARFLWRPCCCYSGEVFSGSKFLLLALALMLRVSPLWGAAGVFQQPLQVPTTGRTGFTRLEPGQTGVTFTNHLADRTAAENQIRLIGSGVALGDVDGDGWCDIYLCQLEGPNALLRNLGGWNFTNITAAAGVACEGQFSTGCALADLDGDGDLDLLVNAIGGGTRLFLNDGKGRFAEAAEPGLLRKYCATSLTLADVDGDGDLDLYVANYRTTTIRSTGLSILNVNGRRVLRREDRDQYEFTPEGLLLEHGEPDQLYLNDGKAHFTAVSWTNGAFLDEDGKPLVAPPKEWGLSAMFRDVNGDGAPDLYVCNDFWSADRLWLNDGKGRFRAAPRRMLRHTSTFSMGVDFADLNRDGLDDFMVLDMLSRDQPRRLRQHSQMGAASTNVASIEERPQVGHNTLFINRGDGTFAELAQFAGVEASEWSWAVAFVDVDLDGFEDALITAGHGFDSQDADTDIRIDARGPRPGEKLADRLLQYPRLNVAQVAFRNRGDLTFEESATKWGFDTVGVSHGLALADLDHDGDLDVVVNRLNGAAGIYRNESIAPRLLVRLRGAPPNTRGIGARIAVRGGPVREQAQEIISGGRYLSCDEAARVFAAGSPTNRLDIEVTWRNGKRSLVKGVAANSVVEIDERTAERFTPPAKAAPPVPLFTDVSERLGHLHRDLPVDDFALQPLLPHKLSSGGPGVSWADLDGDGWEDLIISGGRGGAMAVFRNDGGGGFVKLGGPFTNVTQHAQSAVLPWRAGNGPMWLLAGQSLAAPVENGACVRAWPLAGEPPPDLFPALGASAGPLALADVDGDGQLDLFVGGRFVPGRFPESAPSMIFRGNAEGFALDEQNSRRLAAVGLVNGATFTDLDGDGDPDLVLACDWGALRSFRNEAGKLSPWNPRLNGASLNELTGWWTGVAAGDFDEDGRMDFIAANWGGNTPRQSFIAQGWRLHFGDFAGRGGVELVEGLYDSAHRRVSPWRDLESLSGVMPWLRERYADHAAFSIASVGEILGDRFKNARALRIDHGETMLFLNRGDSFEVRALPDEAQWSPAFGVVAGDFDGDAHEDVFLAQNFFGVDGETTRYDAGRGLLLLGDGRGGFRAQSSGASGIRIDGEQRGAAASDFDGDGRLDLVVSQNNAATVLLRNTQAKPGVRVRLEGSPGNQHGFGAVLRWLDADGKFLGAAHEVHGGSGWWSLDGAVSILARPAGAVKISVRWPGGKTSVQAVAADAKEVRVREPK